MIWHRRICGCVYVACLVVVIVESGCSNRIADRGTIGGAVKLDGKSVEYGSILFLPIEGAQGAAAGGEIANGRYQLSGKAGAAIGWNRVEIRAARTTGRMVQKPMAPEGTLVEETVEAIPPQFNSASTLKVEVKPGENTANFEITSQ